MSIITTIGCAVSLTGEALVVFIYVVFMYVLSFNNDHTSLETREFNLTVKNAETKPIKSLVYWVTGCLTLLPASFIYISCIPLFMHSLARAFIYSFITDQKKKENKRNFQFKFVLDPGVTPVSPGTRPMQSFANLTAFSDITDNQTTYEPRYGGIYAANRTTIVPSDTLRNYFLFSFLPQMSSSQTIPLVFAAFSFVGEIKLLLIITYIIMYL